MTSTQQPLKSIMKQTKQTEQSTEPKKNPKEKSSASASASASPYISNIQNKNAQLQFTMSGGPDVSVANALRRTIIADLEVIVFKTAPYEENKCTIYTNTSRFHNEFIKHRLSGIPIHINLYANSSSSSSSSGAGGEKNIIPYQNLLLELNIENKSDTIITITTADFKIKDKLSNKYLTETETRAIFPPSTISGDYFEFLRLCPKLGDELVGEKLHLTCEFSKEPIKKDGNYKTTCVELYFNTPDIAKQDIELAKKIQTWRDDENNKKENIDLMVKNWKLLEGKRIFVPNSYEFIIESIGVYKNKEIIVMACDVLLKKLVELDAYIEKNENNTNTNTNTAVNNGLTIEKSATTMPNCMDITLINEDYTLGNLIHSLLFAKFYKGIQIMTFCGVDKPHPHNTDIIIRVAYKEPVEREQVYQNIKECIREAVDMFEKIRIAFI